MDLEERNKDLETRIAFLENIIEMKLGLKIKDAIN